MLRGDDIVPDGTPAAVAHEPRSEDVVGGVPALAVADQTLHMVAQAVLGAVARADAVEVLLLRAPARVGMSLAPYKAL